MHRVMVVASLLVANAVQAEPGVIKVFEAKAFAQPKESSTLLHTFVEGDRVSVSEESERGWRRVRLPDGRNAWIRESSLDFSNAQQPTAPAKSAPIYIKDLRHMAELMSEDRLVQPRAQRLATRRTAGLGVLWGGVGLGIALTTAGVIYGAGAYEGDPSNKEETSLGLVIAGGGLILVGVVVGVATLPSREDVLDVINSWNTRHPDQPVQLGHGEARR